MKEPIASASAPAVLACEAARPNSNARSLVAGVNAMFRAIESRRTTSARILDDPFAHRFAERDPRVVLLRLARYVVPGLRGLVRELQTAHCIRHRAIDALVAREVRRGASQIVLVGAGYDMRAFRIETDADHVRWFEVNHPATQARKTTLLRERERANARVLRVGIDLSHEGLAERLARAGFDRDAPACFVLEGLVHYLTPPRLQRLFTDMSSDAAPRSIILSFIHSDMYARAGKLFVRTVRALREVPRWHTTPDALAALATRHAFDRCVTWTNAEQVAAFAPEAQGRAVRLCQNVAWLSNAALRSNG